MGRLEFRSASLDDVPKVEAFNRRLAAAGETYHQLSVEKPFRTMLHPEGSPITVERILCLDDGEVRGGIGLKRMMFRVQECFEEVAVSVYPISEGIINPDYAMIGFLLQKEMLRRYPLMYSLGSPSTTPAKLKQRTGWFIAPVPFHFTILRGASFLRNIAYLRKRRWLRILLEFVAISGISSLSLGLLTLVQRVRLRYPNVNNLSVEKFDCWGDWADQVWDRAQDRYSLIGDRSKLALQSLYPDGHDHLIKLRIKAKDEGRVLGWAVLTASQLRGHRHFGDMRLGAMVDMLAEPEDAYAVVSGALAAAKRAKADLVVVNHSEKHWNDAFARAGMVSWKTNYHLFLSPKLRERFDPIEESINKFYFTRGDGHGPTQFWLVDQGDPDVADTKINEQLSSSIVK